MSAASQSQFSQRVVSDHTSQQSLALIELFKSTRMDTESLASGLSPEDCQLQSMPDASPVKWHLAHTTWFFETFVLARYWPDYQIFNPHFRVLFNSYYNAVGEQYSRPKRGVISRPGLSEVMDYRRYVDQCLTDVMVDSRFIESTADLIEIGIHHEKQHQELILMDFKHALFQNPAFPAFAQTVSELSPAVPLNWSAFEGGLTNVGTSDPSFSYDNERPSHQVYLQPFRIANRLITNAEYLEFINDQGYQRSEFWLSDGWAWVQENTVTAPLYWLTENGQDACSQECQDWQHFSLSGLKSLQPDEPVSHISYFEASAYAAWRKMRLPTEFEWEHASRQQKGQPNYLNLKCLEPRPAGSVELTQMLGDLWEWTSSSYSAYPGYRPFAGEAGEYNGKFMCGQFVLRGGACITPQHHVRNTYRNFFYPHQRWQYSGIRLAEDLV